MKKSYINPMPEYFDRYINLVADIELSQAFDTSINQLNGLDLTLFDKLEGKRYAPDKWTVKDIFQHIIDTERVFSYRALRFARNDTTTLPGYDEQHFGAEANANNRTVHSILEELTILHKANKMMFESFDDTMFLRTGKSWEYELSVLSIGFIIIGHQLHHLKIIEERYVPLIK